MLQSYSKKAQTEFTNFIAYLSKKGQGGYYDAVARTIVLRGDHVHISLDWIAQSPNSTLQQKIQQFIEEWRSKEDKKRERLGDRYEISGF